MKGNVAVSGVVVFANLAGFATQLLVAAMLPAKEYAQFSLCMAYGQMVATLGYEWLRQPMLRFGVGADPAVMAARRSILFWAYCVVSAALVVLSIVFGALTTVWAAALSFAVAGLYGACQGAFDGVQALARAEAANRRFTLSWAARTLMSLALGVGTAAITRSGSLTVLALAISFCLSALLFHRQKIEPPSSGFDWSEARALFAFGGFASLAGSISALALVLTRELSVGYLGLADSAALFLAIDLSQRVLSIVGLAINVVVSQRSFHTMEFGTDEAKARQKAWQLTLPTAIIAPAAVGFWVVQRPLMSLVIAPDYHLNYMAAAGWACVSAAVLAIRAYSIDPIFMMSGRSRSALVGPVVTLIVTVASLKLLDHTADVEMVACAIAAGALAGLIAAALAVSGFLKDSSNPIPDLVKAGFSSALMFAVLQFVPPLEPIFSLATSVFLGVSVYVGSVYLLNTFGVQRMVKWQALR